MVVKNKLKEGGDGRKGFVGERIKSVSKHLFKCKIPSVPDSASADDSDADDEDSDEACDDLGIDEEYDNMKAVKSKNMNNNGKDEDVMMKDVTAQSIASAALQAEKNKKLEEKEMEDLMTALANSAECWTQMILIMMKCMKTKRKNG